MPTLHPGGVQTAVKLTPPAALVETVPVPALGPVPLATVSVPFAGDDEMKVSVGIGFVMLLPKRSITVGVITIPPPALLVTAKDVFVTAFPT